ncbi:hypothetical protein L1987_13447 [Smallanthus sonchifolius]|uniref:Uncharacterized protein n=1 Tax=Smallanthus sonchifolius TaxID=185202 RepID=A0ACB9JHG4_9ASTR|nr:hypothetical protein L1987_13447 [Smallanthus sonchifolius]
MNLLRMSSFSNFTLEHCSSPTKIVRIQDGSCIVVRHWLTIAVPSALSLSVAFAERLLLQQQVLNAADKPISNNKC